jgi:chorismate--pyruvate lyase
MSLRAQHKADGWLPASALRSAPALLQPWLTDAGSLTARLVARCSRFSVRVLRQGYAVANEDERRLIGLAHGECAWVREVLLLADDHPVVFAHTVLHPAALRGPWRMAAGIGGRPLGAALFADPRVARGRLHARALVAAHPLHRHAVAALVRQLPTLWARRSRFLRADWPLLVTEVFLPGIEKL